MPATAAAAISARQQIVFSKNAVFIFIVIMKALY
jgi:hypothetical protein